MKLERGSVVLLDLDPTRGHEQRGTRPCVIVSDAEVLQDQKYPLVAIVPVTGTLGKGALYPRLAAGKSGLVKSSSVLIDQIRSVDKRRIRAVYGKVSASELASIDEGLILFLGLAG